ATSERLARHVMSSAVSLIMAKLTGAAPPPKVVASIENCLDFLDAHIEAALAALPADLLTSFPAVSLFCLVTPLPWREVMDVSRWSRLGDFARELGQRDSARATE